MADMAAHNVIAQPQGMNAQCVQFSPEHNAVIVTMGNGGGCGTAWQNTRAAIVSTDHPLYNTTRK